MSKKQAAARDALKKFMTLNSPVMIESGEVTAVDEAAFTCTVKLAQDIELHDVMLKTLREAEKGVVLIPKVGSYVRMICVNEPDYMVVAAEEVTKIIVIAGEKMEVEVPELVIDIAGTKVEIRKDLFQLNGGGNGGVVKLKVLEENLGELKKYVETMKSAVSDGLSAVGIGTAANGGTGKGKFEQGMELANINFKDMENPRFKH